MATGTEPTGQRAKKRTRIMIDVSPELRRRIKLAAAREDVTIRTYLERIIDRAVPTAPAEQQPEYPPISKEYVERLLQFRDELARKYPDVTYEDSVEVIRQMREERTKHLEELP